MKKRTHEIRDPIHTFVRVDSDEREVVDSSPLQRLRHIHQLAMSYLVYPGATHKRFEHSLGVMELSGRVFDVITAQENLHDSVCPKVPSPGDELNYWRRVLRMAALCHDVGHLPFSHAAERELLPHGWTHERLTIEIIRGKPMLEIWQNMTPPLRWQDIVKLAVGPEKCAAYIKAGAIQADELRFNDWQTILAEVIVSDAFGVDRMDYLLRDAYHAGVVYGRFDHYRLIDTLRILPKRHEEESDEPALGVEEGGLRSAEALSLARYFMYSQLYFHPVRRIYDVHLKDFLCEWLRSQHPNGRFPTSVEDHLALTDNEVTAAILQASRDEARPGHDAAELIVERQHFRRVYQWHPDDARVNREAGKAIYEAACAEFGVPNLRHDPNPAESSGINFPVLAMDGRVVSSLAVSNVLQQIPPAAFDYVFARGELRQNVEKWIDANRATIIQPKTREETDGTAKA